LDKSLLLFNVLCLLSIAMFVGVDPKPSELPMARVNSA